MKVEMMIRAGFMKPSMLKRSTWKQVSQVMEFLAKKGLVVKCKGDVKFASPTGGVTDAYIESLVKAYKNSMFQEHIGELEALAKTMKLPVVDVRVLNKFLDTL